MEPESPSDAPSREELLVSLDALQRRLAALEQDKRDLEVMLETTTNHADDLSAVLEQERNDLETMLEMTTDHADAIEEELQSKAEELAARSQFIRDTFGRYISDEVVAQLLDSPQGLELGGEKRRVTILMSDLRGFTAVAERLDPQEVMTFLNRYLDAMVNVILSYRGTIIEILGDGLLVIFGAPIQQDDDAERAVACACAMELQMEGVNTLLREENLPEIEMGIGIHTADIVVGNIGSRQRMKYGVVGSAVNLTGRIESYTTGNQILLSSSTYKATATLVVPRRQMSVTPKGLPEPITLYDVSGITGEHQLFLSRSAERLVRLKESIAVRYTVLDGKFAGGTVLPGQLVKLAMKSAELQSDAPIEVFSDLKLQLLNSTGGLIPGELFAKVLEVSAEDPPNVVLGFTSLPETAKALFGTLTQYEYHLIDHSEHGWIGASP